MTLRCQFIFVDKAIKKCSNHIEQEDDDALKTYKEDSNGIATSDQIDFESEEDSDSGDDSDLDDRSISQGKSRKFDDKENKKKNGFDIVPQGSVCVVCVWVCVCSFYVLYYPPIEGVGHGP